MKNNYLIISDDKITIDIAIKDIIKKINISDLEIIKHSYDEFDIDSLLEELNTCNFLSTCKLIIYENCMFLSKDTDKKIKELKKYLDNPADNYLIMINDSLSERKEIKDILNNVEVINNKVNIDKIIKDSLGEFKMDSKTINYLISYCLNNNEKIINELEKLKCYKLDESDKNITIDDINKVVIRDYNDDIFDLVNKIIKHDKNKAFELFYRLLGKEKDAVNIIASVSGSIRNLYSTKVLYEKKYKEHEIVDILKIKPYAVQIALENSYNYSSKKLLYLLNLLSDIDYKTKSGNGQAKILFEMFLLSL